MTRTETTAPLEVVVARRINQQTHVTRLQAGTSVRVSTYGRLRIDEPFVGAGSSGSPRWRTTGRLYRRGPRLVLFARVEIELVLWADRHGELTVRPAAQHVALWSELRRRRYFDLAHRGAESLLCLLTADTASVTACLTPDITSKSSSASPETTSLVPSV